MGLDEMENYVNNTLLHVLGSAMLTFFLLLMTMHVLGSPKVCCLKTHSQPAPTCAPKLAAAIGDAGNWSRELHHPYVLEENRDFEGAVWDFWHSHWQPDGVVVWHKSPFSIVLKQNN